LPRAASIASIGGAPSRSICSRRKAWRSRRAQHHPREVEPEIKKLLPPDGLVTYGAAANHLDNALWTMGKNFALAVMILFLIMAAMFKSLRDSAIATIALPLGTVGGVAALQLVGLFTFQPLDLPTMIGCHRAGPVVNNTIPLVARTRQARPKA
jgi:multidrug efflux pump subunit AcrB